MGLPAAAESCDARCRAVSVLRRLARIVCRCGDSPAYRPTFSTGVLIPLVMVPQPVDDTTMHIQLSVNSIFSGTSLQHTDSPPKHLIMQMVSSTHGFRRTTATCELKHRCPASPFLRRCGVTAGLRFMLILVAYLHSAMKPLPHM
ncbi:hypothetical protein AVEN_53408-1 [Araneus ventricosus]|uniref:Uncharacterized protein n=1 Tax=Araneus ventricosus TaxID=182803 RepID=A0A4Y2ABY1_ARAVE|nr:hypothetical protein AVEN_53408-1 [Araneus ventricosus]